jgi:hypothetical protein
MNRFQVFLSISTCAATPRGEQHDPAHADADASLDGLHMQNVNALADAADNDAADADDTAAAAADDADAATTAVVPAANAGTATAAAFAAADEPPFDEPLDTSVASAQSGDRSVDRSGVSEAKSTTSGRRGPRGLMAAVNFSRNSTPAASDAEDDDDIDEDIEVDSDIASNGENRKEADVANVTVEDHSPAVSAAAAPAAAAAPGALSWSRGGGDDIGDVETPRPAVAASAAAGDISDVETPRTAYLTRTTSAPGDISDVETPRPGVSAAAASPRSVPRSGRRASGGVDSPGVDCSMETVSPSPAPRAAAPRRGEAVQVDPMKPKLKPPGTNRLKLKCGYTGFKFCFQIQHAPLHRAGQSPPADGPRSPVYGEVSKAGAYTRPRFSST